jgi:hypothetical protein
VAAIFWTWLWGPVGLVLAMPLTVCLLVLAQHVPQLRFITVLLADRPPMSLVERVYQRMLAADENELVKLLNKELKSNSLAAVYDDTLIPALSMAEQDRHADLLSDDQASAVEELAEDLVHELGKQARKLQAEKSNDEAAENSSERPGDSRVICVSLRDEADESCGRMLSELLALDGISLELLSHELLVSEVVARSRPCRERSSWCRSCRRYRSARHGCSGNDSARGFRKRRSSSAAGTAPKLASCSAASNAMGPADW